MVFIFNRRLYQCTRLNYKYSQLLAFTDQKSGTETSIAQVATSESQYAQNHKTNVHNGVGRTMLEIENQIDATALTYTT